MTVCEPTPQQQSDSFTPAHSSPVVLHHLSVCSHSFALKREYRGKVVVVHMHQEVFLIGNKTWVLCSSLCQDCGATLQRSCESRLSSKSLSLTHKAQTNRIRNSH